MFYQLPPVGNPVSLSVRHDLSLPAFLSSSSTQFYASGTAALAAALAAAIKAAMVAKTGAYAGVADGAADGEINNAEIILPAYGCPDLVSAVVFAGAKPVLVDLEAGLPWMDLVKLAEAVNANTVAIVGVNLFGIAERWPQLRELAERSDLVLIEDSAQYFPGGEETVAESDSESDDWQGDLVVFSFGRGKPVSLLGSGAVFCRNPALCEFLPKPPQLASGLKQKIIYAIKATLYNAMISPRLYWLPQSLPFLHLGETRYHELPEIKGIDEVRKQRLPANVLRYQGDKKAVKNRESISKVLKDTAGVVDLPEACLALDSSSGTGRRLLRYPILVDATVRDALYHKLKQAGLGVSIMYPASLPEIDGLAVFFPGKASSGQAFPEAQAFASRLITLPVHAGVSEKDIERMAILLGIL